MITDWRFSQIRRADPFFVFSHKLSTSILPPIPPLRPPLDHMTPEDRALEAILSPLKTYPKVMLASFFFAPVELPHLVIPIGD